MKVRVREAEGKDAEQMLKVYNSMAPRYVGFASRDIRAFRRLLRKRENQGWVAFDEHGKIVGYLLSRFEKRRRRGHIEEVVVDPGRNFESVAKPLVDRAYNALAERRPAVIFAGSLRNPDDEKIFPPLGFFESESTGVFMFSVVDVAGFLREVTSIFVDRLKRVKSWNGLLQVECEGKGIFIEKDGEKVEALVWTNRPVTFKILAGRELLARLLLGVVDPVEAYKAGQLRVETALNESETSRLLGAIFPERQFLIMDYW